MSNTISSLSQLTDTDPISEEEIHAIIKNLSIKMYNIMNDGGHMAGVDIQLPGKTGADVKYSVTLEQIRKLMEFYTDLLANPQKRGDFAVEFQQSFPEEWWGNVSDFPTRYT